MIVLVTFQLKTHLQQSGALTECHRLLWLKLYQIDCTSKTSMLVIETETYQLSFRCIPLLSVHACYRDRNIPVVFPLSPFIICTWLL